MSPGTASLIVHLVAHTHWDREWYLPAGRVRQRLVALIDSLLDTDDSGEPFLLDGQAVIIDDYLAVRPERHDALAARLRRGEIEAGPWYVLADELIPSGEALIRNLLAGRAVLDALGAAAPLVLYSPDAFGHPAALPMLAAGFGCALVVLWRGYGGPLWPAGDTVRWQAPDGSTVLLYHLPPDGYEFGSNLPDDERGAAERWATIHDVLALRAVLGVTLLPNGADHHARQPNLARAVDVLARAAAPDVVRRSTLRAFAADVEQRAAAARLPCVSGELRASYGYTWTLQGTFGTRAHLKRRNAAVERLLVRDAEPWAALVARRMGRSHGALTRAAWTALLLCHPHDTLCGCAIDEVARAMAVRLDDAEAQGHGLREDAIADLIGHDPARARMHRADWQSAVIVRNRVARPRGGIAELEVARFRQHVRVGPGSSGDGARIIDRPPTPIALRDAHGELVPVQVLSDTVRHDRIESPLHYPHDDLVDAARVVAWLAPVSGYGLAPLRIEEPGDVPVHGPDPVRMGDAWLDNGVLRVELDADGLVRLSSRATGLEVSSLLSFEDVGDIGDLYTHSPCAPVVRPSAFLGTRPVHAGPLRGELHAAWRIDVPIESSRDHGRSDVVRPLIVNAALTLDAAAPFLRVHVWGVNNCHDHRLRVVFSTGLERAAVWADAAFGPVRREPIIAPAGSAEMPPPTAPLARYVTLATAERGVTIYSDGLAEYEAMPSGDVAITLFRAVGELSRNDLPERPGHAGWPVSTPEAQSIGPFEGRFAIFPHAARNAAMVDAIERVADDVLLPLTGSTLRAALSVSAPMLGVELEGAGLAFAACKESERGDWLVLRCVNLTERDVAGRWRCGFPIAKAQLARLDETPLDALPHSEHTVEFRAGPRAMVTVLVR